MTLDEIRDELAKLAGWKFRNGRWYHPVWHRLGSGQKRHPIPPTLEEAAKLPEGWTWARWGDGVWIAQPPGQNQTKNMIEVPDTGDERYDRMYLRLLCERAEKESK